MKHRGFPSAETLAAFSEQRLDPDTRRRMIEHLATCSECFESWTAGKKLEAQKARARRLFRRVWMLTLAATAVAALAIFVLLPPLRSRLQAGQASSDIEALIVSAGELPFRAIKPRLSPAFSYRPLRQATRGRREAALVDTARIAGSASEIRQNGEVMPRSSNLYALGLSYLLLDRTEDAVQTLEQAKTAKATPEILSDLGAAYYAKGLKLGTAADIAQSLELCDAALSNSPDSLPAQFNRALALEALENGPAASAAWQRYLQLDSASEWALEARQHISRLTASPPSSEWKSLEPRLLRLTAANPQELGPIAERFPLRTRRTVEDQLLPRWARASLQDNESEAGRVLAALEVIGAATQRRFGDPTLADITSVIAAAVADRDRKRLDSLAHGHLAYGQARAAKGEDSAKERALFAGAWKDLRKAGSPSAYAAGMYAAVKDYERRDYDEAIRLLTEIKADRALARYAPLAGQVLWIEGMVLLASGRPYESLQRYRESIKAFERSGETESVAAVEGLLAENLQSLGDDEEAWKHRLRALPVTLAFADVTRQQVALNEAAEAAMQQNQLSAALEYQTSSVALVARSGDDEMAAYAYLGRSLILGRRARIELGLADLARARECTARIRDAAIRESTTASIDMAEALLRREESPATAIPLFTRVLKTSGRYEFHKAQLLLARGRAYARLGDHLNARSDFYGAIAMVESQREQVADLRLRSSFFGRADDAYEELTALLVRSGEFAEALRIFDRSCERTLTEVVRGTVMAELKSRVTADRLPVGEGMALVEVAVLPDEIVAWTMRHSGTSVSRRAVPSARVDELVTSYERAIDANSNAVEAIGSELYDLVIRPLGLNPSSDQTITFITNRMLRRVPLASLYDRERKRYLVDDFAIATAPSAAIYWLCSARRSHDGKAADVVAIGNTKVSTLPLGLADLPEAERELVEIASRSHGQLLLNERATPNALLAAAAGNVVLHFAGHALIDEQDRGRSALVLSPDGRDPSSALLYANRIAGARLRAPLVVLSTCTTNSASRRAAKGAMDVAGAFLAAGVTTVVASRWDVSDDRARDFLTSFARELAGSVSPAEALRRSQLEMLHRRGTAQRAVRSWCAFDVIGAV
jgi:CHAT domain-containing protein